MKRLQKNVTRFWEWAEEKMEVEGLNSDMTRAQAQESLQDSAAAY
jgi:hypothetical protein